MDNTAKKIEDLFNGLGAMAEMALQYYRTLTASGATEKEATNITEAFLEACLNSFGGGNESD